MRVFFSIILAGLLLIVSAYIQTTDASDNILTDSLVQKASSTDSIPVVRTVDSLSYYRKLASLANGDTTGKWPIKPQTLPLQGALLPQHRIVAYYGNLYSAHMGILGEYPPQEMLKRLDAEVKKWNEADSSTLAIPALHYIAVTAQSSPGKDGKYRLRMPDKQIDSILNIAKLRPSMLVFLDIQVALSTLQDEIPRLEKYLKMPQVHLGIDPEFSMKDGSKPGTRIGSLHAEDVNYASGYLARLVQEYHLPPKMLVVHRFTKDMVKQTPQITLRQEVQLIMDMDGWGPPALKKATYNSFIYREPVQFTGFKLFYKNDLKQTPKRMLTPKEVLELKPMPSYIQYQ